MWPKNHKNLKKNELIIALIGSKMDGTISIGRIPTVRDNNSKGGENKVIFECSTNLVKIWFPELTVPWFSPLRREWGYSWWDISTIIRSFPSRSGNDFLRRKGSQETINFEIQLTFLLQPYAPQIFFCSVPYSADM